MTDNKLITLIIMDGVGMPKLPSVSAVTEETTPNLQKLAKDYLCGTLEASELAVGLPVGQTGTSEVGHQTIGSGRVTYQSIVRINREIESGSFEKNTAIGKAIENCKKNNKAMHLMGIVSDGGIHSHINHLIELIRICAEHKLERVYVHFIADGRDTPPKSALLYVKQLKDAIKKYKTGEISDVCGRFYALDRDKNWDRVKLYYDALTRGIAKTAESVEEGINTSYEIGEKDEFIKPIVITKNGKYEGKVCDGDSLIMFNFRTDRARQTARVFSNDNDFDWTTKLNLTLVTLTNYDESLGGVIVAYDQEKPKNILGEVLADRGYTQLRIAETEKYAHVTFFFNSGKNEPFKDESRILINSEKVATYDLLPEMSAEKIAKEAIKGVNSHKFNVIVLNFANGDMVGHSGNFDATKTAVKFVDQKVSEVVNAVIKAGGVAIVTADHGNSDYMVYPDGTPNKSHSLALVPIIIVGEKFKGKGKKISGTLADIAPTVLKLLGEKIPEEMTGKTLV
ncbi:MAG: 2,3-bisphosphoglycerate-independent phosphoglycerate mutase [Clostridia bacterium]|nr:2,3-bisphosphoglycerate-independent phosphoglycerate mutase [Clostridia bacterium]